MHAAKLLSVLASLLALALAQPQTCKPASSDLVVLQNIPPGGFPNPNGGPPVDNAKGTYGGENVDFTFTGKEVNVVPRKYQEGYWFFKMEPYECWDATGYNAFEFDFTAPAGSDFEMTLTIHTSVCLVNNCALNPSSCPRAPDSTYVNIKKVITPNGRLQHAVVPFSLFNSNVNGGKIDWRYVKDFTFIKFSALNQKHTFNNFIVKKGCQPGSSPVPSSSRPVSTTSRAASSSRPPSPSSSPGKLGAWEFCTTNSQCANNCCSKQYSNDGKYKCTPGSNQCTGAVITSPVVGTLKDWDFCTTSGQCANRCCSKQYSNDGKLKCTPGGSPSQCV